jgi:hypothetical protein
MKAVVSLILALGLQVFTSSPVVQAQPPCRFVLGFADAVTTLGSETAGECLEDQRTLTSPEVFDVGGRSHNLPAGVTVQRTTKGLLAWLPESRTRFATGDGLWIQNGQTMNYLTWQQWDAYLASRDSAPASAMSPPAPAATPVPAAVQDQRSADAECFNIYANALIGTLYLSPAESDRVKAEAAAANYLCGQAAERDGARGVDCFSSAWEAAKGMERVFAGSGQKVYADKYASCIGR